jgi:hypothetical protein
MLGMLYPKKGAMTFCQKSIVKCQLGKTAKECTAKLECFTQTVRLACLIISNLSAIISLMCVMVASFMTGCHLGNCRLAECRRIVFAEESFIGLTFDATDQSNIEWKREKYINQCHLSIFSKKYCQK